MGSRKAARNSAATPTRVQAPSCDVLAAPSLEVTVAGIVFPTPVLAGPGPVEFGRQVQAVYDLRAFGGIITKSVSLEARPGYPGPTIVETTAGWLNAVGLKNPGLAAFLARDLPFLRALGRPVVVSIVGHAVEEFAEMAAVLDDEAGVAALEVNVSCPNVADGLWFGTDPARTFALVAAVRRATRRPLFVKLGPNVTDIVSIARAAADAGADGLSLVNTLQGLAVDARTRRPRLAAGLGGLSGPAIKPVALRMVWEVAQHLRLPIIGMGGVQTAEDAVEFLLCGARAVAVASGLLANPRVAEEITRGLCQFLVEQGVARVTDLVGQLEFPGAVTGPVPAGGARAGRG
ncbi:MAG: dihydroorotate dehydrogenase [Armatimonadota bacterium]|nr:dihydroorotate dehydrogenase [Armatimonadota bacterium]MDR7532442.1 dihydroorotate dehydrogenase [Armatimonadota bacterium]MDR7535665.1 dihydroorotate dehydrogenase [Armatimonadota bacterium]